MHDCFLGGHLPCCCLPSFAPHQSLRVTADQFTTDDACASFAGKLEVEPPNGFFNKFSGTLSMGRGSQALPLTKDQSLLRGCVLRNVDYVYAMVVYTGTQTKVRVKQTMKVFKKASVESVINHNILLLVVMLVTICSAGSVLFVVWTMGHEDDSYLDLVGSLGFLKVRDEFVSACHVCAGVRVCLCVCVLAGLVRVLAKYVYPSQVCCLVAVLVVGVSI